MEKYPIVAGNWKMHKTTTEGKSFVEETINMLLDIEKVTIIFGPPFTALFDLDVKTPFFLGAQNCHWESHGAFTGEISTDMLVDCGVHYVIIGHSERRHVFHESDDWINRKVHAVLNAGMTPILCIGEKLEDRESDNTQSVLSSQLIEGLKGIDSLENIVLAYEPVWAIGTGITASVGQVNDTHNVPILYGGSVNPGNATELISVDGVDGFLIGGASLTSEPFTEIARQVEQHMKEKS
jgi:triosephosphate isomerase